MTTKYTFRLECRPPGDEPRTVEITFDKGDAVTYTELLEQFKYFLMGCGYDYLHGDLEFVELEAEKTMDRMAKPEQRTV